LFLALRYLRPKRTFVSVITLISIAGVMLGVAVLIIVISVMNGFDKELRDKVLGFRAHITITESNTTIQNYAQVRHEVASNPNVKGVAPIIIGQVMMETAPPPGSTQGLVIAPTLLGVDPQAEATVSTLPTNIVAGKFDLRGRGLVMGVAMANQLGLQIGDHVSIYSPRELREMKESKGKETILPDDYQIRGIFDAGYYEYNASFVVVSLENAQDLYDIGDSVHELQVALHNPYQAQTVARELEQTLGPKFQAATWMGQNPLMLAVMVEKNVMLYILFFIVLVAAFGITCTLITFIVMKTREIGLLKAIGASNRQVMWVFLGQSLIVSVLGVAAGLGAGVLALTYRNEFLDGMRRLTGFELFPARLYGFSQLPAVFAPRDIAIICGGSLIICVLAAAFPARHASRLNPVEALHHE
ncbi:MAG TPA: ABC transporter permease, partial [Verrucomicrobiae bacterium]|nr:ABC transporter permease [Verrucomicrobiae bacterium]